MLARNDEWQVDLPHEAGQWVRLRRLSGRQLERAAEVRSNDALESMRSLGDLLKDTVTTEAQAEGAKQLQLDPTRKYDRWTVLHFGLKAWSYPEPCSKENIDELDDQTIDFIVRQLILRVQPKTEEERFERFFNSTEPSTEQSGLLHQGNG